MYLDGQLPGGPASLNTGGQPNPYGTSNLWNNPPLSIGRSGQVNLYGPSKPIGPGSPKSGANPMDQIDNTFYTVPDGGPVVVSPSLATTNGIVQYPIVQPTTLYPPQVPMDPISSECKGLSGLGSGASDGGMDPQVFQDHYGYPAPDPNMCRQIQCGAITQADAGPKLLFDCGNFGFTGPRACNDPICAPYCPTQQIMPGAVPMKPANAPVAPSNFIDTPRSGNWKPCPGYASDGSLISLRNNAMRGMSDCCQSGYQSYEALKVPDNSSPLPLLMAIAALMLLTTSPEEKKKGRANA